jgi:hypothetical protein
LGDLFFYLISLKPGIIFDVLLGAIGQPLARVTSAIFAADLISNIVGQPTLIKDVFQLTPSSVALACGYMITMAYVYLMPQCRYYFTYKVRETADVKFGRRYTKHLISTDNEMIQAEQKDLIANITRIHYSSALYDAVVGQLWPGIMEIFVGAGGLALYYVRGTNTSPFYCLIWGGGGLLYVFGGYAISGVLLNRQLDIVQNKNYNNLIGKLSQIPQYHSTMLTLNKGQLQKNIAYTAVGVFAHDHEKLYQKQATSRLITSTIPVLVLVIFITAKVINKTSGSPSGDLTLDDLNDLLLLFNYIFPYFSQLRTTLGALNEVYVYKILLKSLNKGIKEYLNKNASELSNESRLDEKELMVISKNRLSLNYDDSSPLLSAQEKAAKNNNAGKSLGGPRENPVALVRPADKLEKRAEAKKILQQVNEGSTPILDFRVNNFAYKLNPKTPVLQNVEVIVFPNLRANQSTS